MPSPFPVLPTFYYHDHFDEMVSFVENLYGDFLNEAERHSIASYRRLNRESQCLFIRMYNRKKTAFSLNDLKYAEIEDIQAALNALRENFFIRPVSEEDYQDFLKEMSKAELTALADRANIYGLKSSSKKADSIVCINASLSFEKFCLMHDVGDHVVPVREPFGFLSFLYFGKAEKNLIGFTLRDLGIVSVNDRASYNARFENLAEAKAAYFYTTIIRSLKSAGHERFAALSASADDFPIAVSDYSKNLRNNLLYQLGTHFEKMKDFQSAIALYTKASCSECRERLARLLFATGEKENAENLLNLMIAEPLSDEEYLFATDFTMRKFGKRRTSVFTDLLRNAFTISVDELYRGTPESAAVEYYRRQGYDAYHVENIMWAALFGLLFWEELFEHPESFASGFDRVPKFLKNGQFHVLFADTIKDKLTAVSSGHGEALIMDAFHRRQGEDNCLFPWFDGLEDIVLSFLRNAKPSAFAAMLHKMSRDYNACSDGFPDLMLVRDNDVRFLEVKAEGDQIRRNQLTRLNQLRAAGFDAEICRVEYYVDPMQPYVVIDVETTGGRPPGDRITEIGAVKIRNGEVIDEWQTLINPERRISSFITGLTGIDNHMVADAPVFADIAREFSEFLDGAVFVAHNVNFDYGFIASEFQRLGLPFRHPKLCTAASMRRHYPGHASYSLKNLCAAYEIDLTSHHRALCDAKAAAELLKLVQARRIQISCSAKAA